MKNSIEKEKRNYSLELVEDTLSGTTVVDELITDLADDIFDDVDVNIARSRTRHSSESNFYQIN